MVDFLFRNTGCDSLRRVWALALLTACGPPAPEPARQEEPATVRLFWDASNAQASAVTGNLSISAEAAPEGAIVLAFANGVTVHASPAASRSATEQVGGSALSSFGDLLGAPDQLRVRLYAVSEERVATSAPHGGLCGGLRTRALAIAEFVDEDEQWALRIASFHGDVLSQEAQNPGLCFAYDFRVPESAL